jgi:hypothetical protein
MSVPVWTQFVRNLLFVVKTLAPSSAPYLQVALPTALYPLNQVLIIEFAIALSQFLGALFFYQSGLADYRNGKQQTRRNKQLLTELDHLSIQGGSISPIEYTILRHGLRNNICNSCTKKFSGIAQIAIAIAFTVLMCHSLHIRGSNHPVPVFQALLLVETALMYFLIIMWKGIFRSLNNASKAGKLIRKIDELKTKLYDATNPKYPDYSERRLLQFATEVGFLDNMMDIYQIIHKTFKSASPTNPILSEGIREDLGEMLIFLSESNIIKEGDPKVIKTEISAKLDDYSQRLFRYQQNMKTDALITFISFAVNAIAFYGYMMGVLAFFFPSAALSEDASYPEFFSKLFMLNLSNDDASNYGIFAGDFAWTIEPLLVLFLFPYLKNQSNSRMQMQVQTDFLIFCCRCSYIFAMF